MHKDECCGGHDHEHDHGEECCEDVGSFANDKVDALLQLLVKKKIITEKEFEENYESLFENEEGSEDFEKKESKDDDYEEDSEDEESDDDEEEED